MRLRISSQHIQMKIWPNIFLNIMFKKRKNWNYLIWKRIKNQNFVKKKKKLCKPNHSKQNKKDFFLRITHKKEFQELVQIAQCILVIWALRPKKLWEVWLLSKLPGCDHASQHHKSVLLELLKGNHCLISLFTIYYLGCIVC